MKFHAPLIPGTLIQRYKRFLADVELADGTVVTAHCANPGAMTGLKEPGSRVWLSLATNPKRKLKYNWELIEFNGRYVGIHTAHPNAIVEEAILNGTITELAGYEVLRREVKYGKNSRIDMLLEDPAKPRCYVEVKNVHLLRGQHRTMGNVAEFPDSVTVRGAKHLVELGDMVDAGRRAVMVYLVQREDCDVFSIAGDIDPGYAAALKTAITRGVELLCYRCRLTLDEIVADRPMPIELGLGDWLQERE